MWSPNLSYSDIVKKAQSGDPYHQGLLGIYLRSGEAGCAVNLKLAGDWSRVSWISDTSIVFPRLLKNFFII